MVSQKPTENDPFIEAIGPMGKWQLWICLIVFLVKFPSAWHQLGITFLAPAASFQCLDTVSDPGNLSASEFDSVCVNNCSQYLYDRELFSETIITDFDLICSRSWLKDFTQTIFMMGILVGSSLFGFLADRFGRRIPLIVAVIVQLGFGVGSAFARDYTLFTCLRFVTGCASGGTMVTSFVIVMEIVGTQYREAVGALYQLPFIFGHILMPAFGYFCRTWYNFQLAISVPSIIFLSYICILPESPRWLISVGRKEEALRIMYQAADWNKLPLANLAKNVDEITERTEQSKFKDERKPNFIDLFRNPGIRKRSICTCVLWAVCGCCFYGVAQYVGYAGGNIFANVALAGAIQVPGNFVAIYSNRIIGRKITTMASSILAGCSLLAIAVSPALDWLTILLSTLGIFFITITFASIYIYTSELFPTVVRNMGVGLGSTSARVGSMIAPFIATASGARWVAPVIFGLLPLNAAAACFFLPETKGEKLMDNLDECE